MDAEKDLQKKFDSLPEALKEALTSVDLSQKLQLIGKSNGLHLDEVDALMEEIGFVMLGETRPNDFGSKVSSRLSLTREKTDALVKSVDEEIFKPIRSFLVELHQEKPTMNNAQPTTQPVPQVPSSNIPSTSNLGPDYDMSRDAILSAIENPTPREVKIEIPSLNHIPETSDPKEYLKRREDVAKKIEEKITSAGSPNTPIKKPSLLEEAILVAKKKVPTETAESLPIKETKVAVPPKLTSLNAVTPAQPPATVVPKVALTNSPLPPTPQVPLSPKINAFPPSLKASDKLNNVVQLPRTVVNTANVPPPPPTSSAESRSVDPYREQV